MAKVPFACERRARAKQKEEEGERERELVIVDFETLYSKCEKDLPYTDSLKKRQRKEL